MSLRQYKLDKKPNGWNTGQEYEYCKSLKRWELISSWGGWDNPSFELPEQALRQYNKIPVPDKCKPHVEFYACVYYFRNPAWQHHFGTA